MSHRGTSTPERGWYSLTVGEETAKRVGELARARGSTVDKLINQLMTPAAKGFG